MRGTSPVDTAMDLVIEDGSRVGVAYFLMSEDNVRQLAALPWVSFGSDGSALRIDGPLSQGAPHPRSYGTYPRIITAIEEAARALQGGAP